MPRERWCFIGGNWSIDKIVWESGGRMQVYVRMKIVGKRRAALAKVPFEAPDNLKNVEELITYIVKENVRKYNEKGADDSLIDCLTQAEFERGEGQGKIGFRDRMNANNQDEAKAVANAIQCFKDGIYKILIEDQEVTWENEFELKENDTVTFIRLVMLAGRLW